MLRDHTRAAQLGAQAAWTGAGSRASSPRNTLVSGQGAGPRAQTSAGPVESPRLAAELARRQRDEMAQLYKQRLQARAQGVNAATATLPAPTPPAGSNRPRPGANTQPAAAPQSSAAFAPMPPLSTSSEVAAAGSGAPACAAEPKSGGDAHAAPCQVGDQFAPCPANSNTTAPTPPPASLAPQPARQPHNAPTLADGQSPDSGLENPPRPSPAPPSQGLAVGGNPGLAPSPVAIPSDVLLRHRLQLLDARGGGGTRVTVTFTSFSAGSAPCGVHTHI